MNPGLGYDGGSSPSGTTTHTLRETIMPSQFTEQMYGIEAFQLYMYLYEQEMYVGLRNLTSLVYEMSIYIGSPAPSDVCLP